MERFASVQKYDQDEVSYFLKMGTNRRYLHFIFGGQTLYRAIFKGHENH